MTNLIPEKRLDRNGKLVTKHVRATPEQGAGRSSLPAPSTGTKSPGKTVNTVYKPLPRQLKQQYHGHRLAFFKSDDPLTTADERETYTYSSAHSSFEASDAEVYDVLSATTSSGNALQLLMKGIRTAKEARSYLKRNKAAHLITDRSELTTAAFERGMNSIDFIQCYELLEQGERDSPYVLDAVEYKKSALNYDFNGMVIREIVNGDVALADIKAIGMTRLKPHARAYNLTGILTKLNKGEADYSVGDVKNFVILAAEAKTNAAEFRAACEVAVHQGFELFQSPEDFSPVVSEHSFYMSAYGTYKRDHDKESEEQLSARVAYGAKMRKGVNKHIFSGSSTDYFNAGMPVELAIDTINGGGGFREAQAIHEDGIQSSVSGGWL